MKGLNFELESVSKINYRGVFENFAGTKMIENANLKQNQVNKTAKKNQTVIS